MNKKSNHIKKTPKGEIISIGDELISGKILNTTSEFAAKVLFSLGYQISRITAIGDDPEDIEECLLSSLKRADFVIVTGGLGPTTDDITSETVSKVLGRKLVFYNEIYKKIKEAEAEHFLGEKLAWLPQGAEVLNPDGHAAGYLIIHEGIPIFFLPGVPDQLEDHMVNQVIPRLENLIPDHPTILQRTFKIFGLSETEINSFFEEFERSYDTVSFGYYPNFPEVHLTVTVRDDEPQKASSDLEMACAKIRDVLGEYIVASDQATLEMTVGKLLLRHNAMLSVAESCTGGLVGHRITKVPGSSSWFERGVITYSNRAKEELLGVSGETLTKHGAVSRNTAIEMAQGIKSRSGTDFSLAITGIAGPGGGTPEKPVGTVYIAMATPEKTVANHFHFSGTRHMIQTISGETALDWLRRFLEYGTYIPGYRTAS